MHIDELILGYANHSELNPKLWQDGHLRPNVKKQLLKIAQQFRDFIDIPIPVLDVLITGGQVSYHYTEQSDLDLHLVIDYSQIECDQEVEELLDSKRLLFKQQHQISIFDIPVEPGTEDINRPTVSSSYSLKKDAWIKQPKNHSNHINQKEIEKQSDQWQKIIRTILQKKDYELGIKCLKMLRKYRKTGLKTTGEYGVPNLVYKTLRNRGLIKQLDIFLNSGLDKKLSLK